VVCCRHHAQAAHLQTFAQCAKQRLAAADSAAAHSVHGQVRLEFREDLPEFPPVVAASSVLLLACREQAQTFEEVIQHLHPASDANRQPRPSSHSPQQPAEVQRGFGSLALRFEGFLRAAEAQRALTVVLVPRRVAESQEPAAAKQQAAPQARQLADADLERTVVPVAALATPPLAHAAAAVAVAAHDAVVAVVAVAAAVAKQPAPVRELAAVEQHAAEKQAA